MTAVMRCSAHRCDALIQKTRGFCHGHWMSLTYDQRAELNDLSTMLDETERYRQAVAVAVDHLARLAPAGVLIWH